MTCTSPFRLKQKDGYVVELPCGHCMACRIARSREWASRIIHEMVYYDKTVFITLTYNNENLPANLSLSKDELQRFFKRLRKSISPRKIRYFACGEYGDQHDRPHYHAIIFGLGLSESDTLSIQSAWDMGFTYSGTVTFNSARYVAGYVLKKYNGKVAEIVYDGKQAPFCLMSKGIGKQFVIDNSQYLSEHAGFTVQGSPVGLPRYYKELKIRLEKDAPKIQVLDLDKESIKSEAIKRSQEILKVFRERGQIDDDDFQWSLLQAKSASRDQADKTLNAKWNLRKRKI